MIISLYVDDLLVTRNNLEMIDKFKTKMKKGFEMTDLGEMSYFLEMQIVKLKMKCSFAKISMQER